MRRFLLAFTVLLIALAGGLRYHVETARATSIVVNIASDPAPSQVTVAGSPVLRFPTGDGCSLRAAIMSAQWNNNAHDSDCATGASDGSLDVININSNLIGQTLTLSWDPDGAGSAWGVQPFEGISGGTRNELHIIGPTTNAADFVIDGANQTRIFHVGLAGLAASFGCGNDSGIDGHLKLANLTVKRGNGRYNAPATNPNPLPAVPRDPRYSGTDGDGGIMHAGACSRITLDNVVMRESNASANARRGGAIFATEATTITNNGGAYVSNTAHVGGGVYFLFGPAVLNGYAVLFEANSASLNGGAIGAEPSGDIQGAGGSSVIHLERSLLKDNTSPSAGGVFINAVVPGKFELWDSTATGNSGTGGGGGGVFVAGTTAQTFEYLRSTFVNNTGRSGGGTFGGLFAGHGLIANSIVKGSTCYVSGGSVVGVRNLVDNGAGIDGCGGLGSLGVPTGVDSVLAQNGGPEVQRTFKLLPGSNAIDNGSATYCGTIDARSVPRGVDGDGTQNSPQTGDCDIGAYEYAKYVVNFVTGTSTGTEGVQSSMQVQVKLSIPDPADRTGVPEIRVNIVRNNSSTAKLNTDFSLPASFVSFPAGNYASGQATANFQVNLIDDNFAEVAGELVILDLAQNTAGVAFAEPRQHTVSIQDNDQAGFLKNDGGNGTTVAEGNATADTFTIRLRSQPYIDTPSADTPVSVTVHLAVDRDCRATLGGQTATVGSPLSFVIEPADWNVNHTISIVSVEDLWDEDLRNEATPHACTLTFTFTSQDIVYSTTTDNYTVNVIDNDVAGVTIVQSGGTTATQEGGATDTYTVVLLTPPDPGDPLPSPLRVPFVTVVANPDSQCTVAPGTPATLTFNATNWNTPQTFTVTAVDDLTVELLHNCVIAHTIGGDDPVYLNLDDSPSLVAGVTASIQDFIPVTLENDPPQVDVTLGSVTVSEATVAVDTLSVVLFRRPLADVTVTLTSSVDPRIPGSQLKVRRQGVGSFGDSVTLTFTPANWNVAQVVEVVATDDDYDEPTQHQASLVATIASTAVGFNDPALRRFNVDGTLTTNTVALPVTVTDDDTSSVDVTIGAGSLSEDGGTVQVSLALGTHPYNPVAVTITPNAQCDIGGGPGTPRTLNFPGDDWNTPKTFPVSAVDDSVIELPASHRCALTFDAASADVLYDVLDGQVHQLPIVDNDLPRVLIATGGGITVNEATPGTGDTYTVVLHSQPDANVTVQVSVAGGQATVSNGVATGAAIDLVFTPANWNAPQTVTVRAVNDNIDESDPHTASATHAVVSTATGYATQPELHVDGVPGSTVAIAIGDDDTAGITLAQSAGSTQVAEGGATDTFTLVLLSEPTATVTVSIVPDAQCDVGAGPGQPVSRVFVPAAWNVLQTVTVMAVDDLVVEPGHTCAIVHATTSSDGLYNGMVVPGVVAQVTDNDVASVSIAGTLSLDEDSAATATYTVVLDRAPLANVSVNITVADGQTQVNTGGGFGSTATLTFTPQDWNQPQTVTVAVVDDALPEAHPHPGSIGHAVSSTAFGYSSNPTIRVNGVLGATIVASILDNDYADLQLTKTGPEDPVTVGTNGTFTIRLTNAGPLAATSVSVRDTLPANTTFVSAVAPGGWAATTPAVGSTGEVVFTKASVADGETAVFTVVVKANLNTPNNTETTNNVLVTATTNDIFPEDNLASAKMTITTDILRRYRGNVTVVITDILSLSFTTEVTVTVTHTKEGQLSAVKVVSTNPAFANTIAVNSKLGWFNFSTEPGRYTLLFPSNSAGGVLYNGVFRPLRVGSRIDAKPGLFHQEVTFSMVATITSPIGFQPEARVTIAPTRLAPIP